MRDFEKAARAAPPLTMAAVEYDAPVQRMPEALQRVVQTCFPGSGPVDDRILKAIAKMQLQMTASSGVLRGPVASHGVPEPIAEQR